MKNCHAVSISMQENLQITNTIINNNKFVNKYQSVVKKFQFFLEMPAQKMFRKGKANQINNHHRRRFTQ